MPIACTLEFVGQGNGWRAAAQLDDGRVITISEAQSLVAVRRRLRTAVKGAGIEEPEFVEKLRIPAQVEAELAHYHRKDRERAALEAEVRQMLAPLAQRLLSGLHLTEREAAAWLGVSHTHLSTVLLAYTADTLPTSEFSREPVEENTLVVPKSDSKR